ncbi:2-oxo-4-hydroxy-4-carboxy-5-ureidoimidazoline decarboxylase [Rathayibacter tanaceti]|uniref:2-oxo-4-hydroxy-4-carboxy-5-ureidoimidazoline decarboxylase n=2 Tax=Rathayibacter tanaceti TaxID=1671680 RepID=A0A162FUM3_9MICO|nr:2-oxo-4-hydroxy-4-carboxy-5-ureidoimidazoline decarboxylase [Rathayibacter tanaceti]KZX19740.1 Uric acid degradation bifunctional protein [Rathayibacter tanaceti]QHC55661.1 2-oxo-4-hydroxy-4-carboxy-5-ureidoimidazoline decarboxylase [Rathayibacter tanaceti]TCO39536.1 2-oxo-4-hydroxy-4-carboxy-5-ureidoimidazoline decarboxylase [Rathayibacter tanaceti]
MTGPTVPPETAREVLLACLAVPRWADEVAAGAPYASVEALAAAADGVARTLSAGEVEAALADHPRIGERHAGSGRSSTFSAAEQATSLSEDEALAARLLAGNRAYEERFGRVFLIRAAGRDRAEIVAELERRLALDERTEARIVAEQLREIAVLRVRGLASDLLVSTEPAR